MFHGAYQIRRWISKNRALNSPHFVIWGMRKQPLILENIHLNQWLASLVFIFDAI